MTFKIEYGRGVIGIAEDSFEDLLEDPLYGCDWFTMDDGIVVRNKFNETIRFYPYSNLIRVKAEENWADKKWSDGAK